jgi:hypothetical protein
VWTSAFFLGGCRGTAARMPRPPLPMIMAESGIVAEAGGKQFLEDLEKWGL